MKLFIIWLLLLSGEANQSGFFGSSIPLAPRQRLPGPTCPSVFGKPGFIPSS